MPPKPSFESFPKAKPAIGAEAVEAKVVAIKSIETGAAKLAVPEAPSLAEKTTETLAERLAERLRLHEQYLSQVKVLSQSGLLENFAPATLKHPQRFLPELGITGVDKQEYFLPEYDVIIASLSEDPERAEALSNKVEQGFSKLLLVPFALPLSVLIERYKQVLIKTHQEKGLKATDGSSLDLNMESPESSLYVWEEIRRSDSPQTPSGKRMEYFVQNYDGQTKEQRGGQYKSEILMPEATGQKRIQGQNRKKETAPAISPGWQVLLVENNSDLPAKGKGQTIGGRKQIEANQSPKEYLKLLQEAKNHPDSPYQGEQGLTPEANLMLWLTYLQEQQTVIDDWQGKGKASWLVGSYVSGRVPYFDWNRDDRRPSLGGDIPGSRDGNVGFRPAARL